MTNVPFLDLKSQYWEIKPEIMASIERVLDTGQYVLGAEVAEFEREFAGRVNAAHGVAMNSGTSALQLALLAGGVSPGDEVITVPLTFVASVAAIEYVGARPVLVDVDSRTYTMDPEAIEAAVTPKTKAIMPVHLYGQPADMDPITEIAKRHGLLVVEDAAQAHLATYNGRSCGALGDLAGFSFYPGKNLGAYGEGGLVTTNDAAYDRTLRMLRDWGQEKKYEHVLKGFNARMEAIQGAILRVKLRYLENWTRLRRERAHQYRLLLADCPGVTIPYERAGCEHVYHIYPLLVEDREKLRKYLHAQGIGTGIHYPYPVHVLEAYRDLEYRTGDFPVAERVAAQVVSLPMFPEMTSDQTETVAHAVREWAAGA